MSWLKKLVSESEYESFRQLAQGMLNAERWPQGEERKPVTISNALSALDRGEKADWWLTGSGKNLLPALAETLGLEDSELIMLIKKANTSDIGTHIFEFENFPALRSLNLLEELPFPGLPEKIVNADFEQGIYLWKTHKGAGRTLAGRWLESHYNWTYKYVNSFNYLNFIKDISNINSRKIFIELEEVNEDIFDTISKCKSNIIVISCDNFELKREKILNIKAIESPNISTWLDRFFVWVGERIQRGGGFDLDKVRMAFNSDLKNLFETPGALLEFLSLVDEVGSYQITVDQFLTHLVSSRLNRLKISGNFSKKIQSILPSIFMSISKNMIANNSNKLSNDSYYNIINSFIKVDDSFKKDIINMVSKSDLSSDEKISEIKTICEDSCEYITKTILNDLGLFAKEGDDFWSFKYLWIYKILQHKAEDMLWNEGTRGVGTLLMCQYTIDKVMNRIFDCVKRGDFKIFDDLMKEGITSKESVAVLNVAYCTLALHVTSMVFSKTQFQRVDLLNWINKEQMIFQKNHRAQSLPTFFHTLLFSQKQWVMEYVFKFSYVCMQYVLHVLDNLSLSHFDGALKRDVFGYCPVGNSSIPDCFREYEEYFVLICIEIYGMQENHDSIGLYILIDKFKRNDFDINLNKLNDILIDLDRLILVCEMNSIPFEEFMNFCWKIRLSNKDFYYSSFFNNINRLNMFYFYKGNLTCVKKIIWLGFENDFIDGKFLEYLANNKWVYSFLDEAIIKYVNDLTIYDEIYAKFFKQDLLGLMSDDYILDVLDKSKYLFEKDFARDVYEVFYNRMPNKAMLRLKQRFFEKTDDLSKQDVSELVWFLHFSDAKQMSFILDIFEEMINNKLIFERLNEQNKLIIMLGNIVEQRKTHWERAVDIVLKYHGKVKLCEP